MPINSRRLRYDGETLGGVSYRLGTAEKQEAAFAQCEMKSGNDLRLGFWPQIDQKVSTRYQIETREWRISQYILHGEDHRAAQCRLHPVNGDLLDRIQIWMNEGGAGDDAR